MKTLLLDKQFQPVSFIGLRKTILYLVKEKVDIISVWEDSPMFFKQQKYPSVLRLKSYIRKRPRVARFNRRGIFRRDGFRCQYSGKVLPPSQLTIDHVLPKARGGKSTWENCVTASLKINSVKGDKTLEEAGLQLLRTPRPPAQPITIEYRLSKPSHPDWSFYFVDASKEDYLSLESND